MQSEQRPKYRGFLCRGSNNLCMHSTTVVVSSRTFMQIGQLRSMLISFLGILTVALGTVSGLEFKV